jgi:hypothetical protein
VLCILNDNIVSISYVRNTSDAVQLDLTAIIRSVFTSGLLSDEDIAVSLLYYSNNILAVHVTVGHGGDSGFIVALRTAANQPEQTRVIRMIQLISSSKLFVRHTAHYLYYGTHTGTGDDGHRKWEISGVSLDTHHPLPDCSLPLLLEKFHGTDIGSTVAFEIFNNHFFAVSNQGTFEVEEVDWTSFYHCVCFPLNNPLAAAVKSNERVFRRQHAQGPIHDSWTDLSLQLDERTNKTMIVESRREWAQASSRQARTFYVAHFGVDPFGAGTSLDEPPLLPENDIYIPLLDSTNKPNWMPTPPLPSWSRHPEFAEEEAAPRSFILARTKFRAYNYSCASFVDLVEDERCCEGSCLRLRIGPRREIGSEVEAKGKGRMDSMEPALEVTFNDNKRYRNAPIRMWPPPASKCACVKRLHGILNPPLASGFATQTRSVTGVLDETALVYMVKPSWSYGSELSSTLGTIVLVDFTRPLTSSAPAMRHSDSKMEDDIADTCWEWTPGLERRCRDGTCW